MPMGESTSSSRCPRNSQADLDYLVKLGELRKDVLKEQEFIITQLQNMDNYIERLKMEADMLRSLSVKEPNYEDDDNSNTNMNEIQEPVEQSRFIYSLKNEHTDDLNVINSTPLDLELTLEDDQKLHHNLKHENSSIQAEELNVINSTPLDLELTLEDDQKLHHNLKHENLNVINSTTLKLEFEIDDENQILKKPKLEHSNSIQHQVSTEDGEPSNMVLSLDDDLLM